MLTAIPYSPEMAPQWNSLIAQSANGTFLLDRQYMDYHADRFTDCSLCFVDKGKLQAVLPASINGKVVTCHGGLTYGPLTILPQTSHGTVHECFQLAMAHYRQLGAQVLRYKPIPYIYIDGCHDEDLYEIFRSGAKLAARSLSTAVYLRHPLKMRELRRRCANKAKALGHTIATGDYIDDYWPILNSVLTEHHNVRPVHTAEEMKLLTTRFPDNIKMYVTRNAAGEVIAGTWLFLTPRVAHAQYITANDEGRATGALDLLFAHLIGNELTEQEWLDFGISTENGGQILNQGLLWQKEGFGGRGVCYDQYEIAL